MELFSFQVPGVSLLQQQQQQLEESLQGGKTEVVHGVRLGIKLGKFGLEISQGTKAIKANRPSTWRIH